MAIRPERGQLTMKINAGETPLEPMFIPDGPPRAKRRGDKAPGKRRKPRFDVLHGGEHWETELCTLPLKRLVAFNDLARAVVIRLNCIGNDKKWNEYIDVLRHIEAKLLPAVKAYPDLAAEPPEKETWNLLNTLIRNVCRCIPNEASERMMQDFYDRLAGREDELKQPHVALRVTKGAEPPPRGAP